MRVLTRGDVLELLTLRDCIVAVEDAFRLHAEGRTLGPGVLAVPAEGGGFHVKAAGLVGERSYFAAKTNANFPDNARRYGLPTIQGTVVLADARTGELLAVMDSGSVTALRTGAATTVAAKFLARPDARSATIVGCGVQGEIQLGAIAAVLPLQRAWVLDTDHARAEGLAARAQANLGIRVEAGKDLRSALRGSDVCVTCTHRAVHSCPVTTSPRAPSSPPSVPTIVGSRSSSPRWWRRRPSWSTCSSSARRSVSSSTSSPPGS